MNNYTTQVLNKKVFTDSTQTTIKVKKNNNNTISPDELKIVTKNLLAKAPKGTKLRIRGLGIDKWINLKSFDKELNIKDEEEYYNGKVKETGKFMNFSQIELVFLKPN
jgi:hypothetical protein